MKEILKKISNLWLDYREHCKTTSKTGAQIKKVKQDHEIYDLVVNQWKDYVSSKVNTKKYLVDSSVGKGNVLAAPWLTIMHKSVTESATEGYYVVYLFSRSAKKLYLSIGIGATQFQDIYGITNKCIEKVSQAAQQFSTMFADYADNQNVKIDLIEDDSSFEEPLKGSSRNLISCFEKGCSFSKEYDLNKVDQKTLDDDIVKYVKIYESIVNDSRSEGLEIIAESLIKPEDHKSKVKLDTNYVIPNYEPKEKTFKIKKSVLSKAKTKRATQESKKIGLAGEDYVYQYEYEKLVRNKKKDLADKIQKHYENFEYPGWDITSFDLQGNEIYIEVKSSKGTSKSLISITKNEWEAAQKHKNQYYIFLVNNVLNESIKITQQIQNPSKLVEDQVLTLEASIFDIYL